MRVALFGAWLLLCGCAGCQQPPALVVNVHHSGFRPDCVVVQAAGSERTFPLGRSAPQDGELLVAVYAPADAGPGTDVTAAARIGDCNGPVAVSASASVSWPASGTRSVPLELVARDGDDDGFLEDVGPPEWLDCDGADPVVFPRATGELSCDGKDEDCRGGVDDTFQVGAACAGADAGCGGAIACAPGAPSTSTVCVALPPPLEYWEDVDRDGFGGLRVGFSCRPDSGWVRVPGDCDDARYYVHPDAGELCDGLDDDCDGTTDDVPGQRCDRIPIPALTSSTAAGPRLAMAGVGRVVVAGGNGGVAYVESDGGVLWRGGVCQGDWYGVWVNPANDRVFLGGPFGALGALDRTGGSCTSHTSGLGYVFALWAQPDGGPSPLINFTNTASEYRTWVLPTTATSYGVQITPCCGNLRSLAGRPNGVMMTSGWLYDGVQRHARVLRSPGQGQDFADLRVQDMLADAGLGSMQAALHDVAFPRDDLAYAVGENSLVVKWDGSDWSLLPPVNDARSFISSVVAFDEQNVYLATGNFILRWDGSAYRVVVFAPNVNFSQVRGSSPDDLWAVANGQVWHFSAGP